MAPAPPLPLPRALLPALLALLAASGGPLPVRAQVQVQLQCTGTLLETRGSAELKRDTQRLAVSLGLEAEAADADGALAALQRRLAAVRQRLLALGVRELRVSSPSTWQRSPEPRSAGPRVVATLQVSGELAPQRLQEFVRQVGGLEGVRLNPVAAEADPAAMPAVRARLLREAYQDALAQARELAAAVGRSALQPLDVRVEGHDLRPVAMRAMAVDAAPFDPAELPQPTDRLALQVRFCAR
ncbi:MAG: SIMPL domain-containing protein [Cyanobium sp.]|jgi:uncharacterized protein YggE